MRAFRLSHPWTIAVSSLIGLALLAVASLSPAAAQPTGNTHTASAPVLATLSAQGSARMLGTVDLGKLPVMKAGASSATTPSHVHRDRMTQQQRAAYWAQAQRGVNIPKAPSGGPKPPSLPSSTDPKFLGGAVIPPTLKAVDGLSSATTGATAPTGAALATDLSYLMEGTDPAVAIYRTSTGALAYGPYATATFFQPIKHAGDTFSDPQMNYDVMRDRWIVTYLEWTPGGLSYLDIAISTSNSPTQPTPGAQYHEYQVPTTFLGGNTACDVETLGVEYYSLTITCVDFDTSNVFKGNTTLVFDKNSLLAGGTATYYVFNNAVFTSLNTCSGACPAFRLSPAVEEGIPDGEFIVATDAGYGVTSSNLTLCALTNLSNISTTAPTLTCGLNTLGVTYADPVPITYGVNPFPTFTVDMGVKQIYFKAGRLFVSFTSALFDGFSTRDKPVWAEIQPQLSTRAAHTPQWVNGALVTQAAAFNFFSNSFSPTLIGTDEDDLVLIFDTLTGIDEGDFYLIYTGRKVTDAPNTMGQDAGTFSYKSFPGVRHSPPAQWSVSSACAIPLNSVTRGIVWCVMPLLAVDNSNTVGWSTKMIQLRLE